MVLEEGTMRVLGAVLALTVAALTVMSASFGAQAAGPRFNCKHAKKGAERMVCSSEELSALDLELAGLYGRTQIELRKWDALSGEERAARLAARPRCLRSCLRMHLEFLSPANPRAAQLAALKQDREKWEAAIAAHRKREARRHPLPGAGVRPSFARLNRDGACAAEWTSG